MPAGYPHQIETVMGLMNVGIQDCCSMDLMAKESGCCTEVGSVWTYIVQRKVMSSPSWSHRTVTTTASDMVSWKIVQMFCIRVCSREQFLDVWRRGRRGT